MCELVAGDHRSPLASGDSRRVAFLETLQKFRTERGKAQFRPPVVHKIELDLYELFRRVCSFGGYASVVKKIGTWSTIWKLLPNYDPCVTDASNRLKKNYEKYLLDFERYCHPEFHQQPQVPLQPRRLSTDGTSLAGSNSSGNSDESVAVNHNDNDGNSSSSGGGNGAAPPGSPTAPSSAELQQQQQPPGTAPGDNRRAPGGANASAAAAAAVGIVTGGVKRGRSATAGDGGAAAADGGGGEQRLVLLCHAIALQQQDGGTQPHTASSSRHQRPLLDVRRPLSAASAKRAKVSAVGRQQRYGEAAAVVVPRHLHRQPQPQQPQAAACFLSLLHSSEDTAVHALLVMSAGGYR